MASDDLSLIHDFRTVKNGEIKNIEENNKIIQKLLTKLEKNERLYKQKSTKRKI